MALLLRKDVVQTNVPVNFGGAIRQPSCSICYVFDCIQCIQALIRHTEVYNELSLGAARPGTFSETSILTQTMKSSSAKQGARLRGRAETTCGGLPLFIDGADIVPSLVAFCTTLCKYYTAVHNCIPSTQLSLLQRAVTAAHVKTLQLVESLVSSFVKHN